MSAPAGAFELWRQDDHGTRFLVGCYPILEDAERRLAELTRTQHKQIYWITPAATAVRTTAQGSEQG